MSILRFSDDTNFVELAVAIEEDAPQAVGDAYVTIRVQSAGFIGHNELWVCASCVRAFCSALAALDKTLRGEALLRSVSPRELDLRIASADSLGHMVISGSTGYHALLSHRSYWHAVQFGFEFEPQQLSIAVA